MKRILVVMVLAMLASGAADNAQAQCYGWPVRCTGINPVTAGSLAPSAAASAGLSAGAYAVGEAIGTAIFGDVDKARPWDARGTAIFNNAVNVYADDVKNCPRALPLFVEAQWYYEKAHQMVPVNIGFNRNLANVHGWIAVCGMPGETRRQGQQLLYAGSALLRKGECRQALLKWAQAKRYFDRAVAMYSDFEAWKTDQTTVTIGLEKLKNGEYAEFGCRGMQTEEQRTAAALKPAKPIDTTQLVQPRPGTQAPSQRQAQSQAKRCPNFGEPHTVCGTSPGAMVCCPVGPQGPHCAANLSAC